MNSELIEKINNLPDRVVIVLNMPGGEKDVDTLPTRELKQLAADYEKLVEQTRWIPCSERLPNKDKSYEVTYVAHVSKTLKTKYCRCAIEVDGSCWWVISDGTVIAWREQAEPYDPRS